MDNRDGQNTDNKQRLGGLVREPLSFSKRLGWTDLCQGVIILVPPTAAHLPGRNQPLLRAKPINVPAEYYTADHTNYSEG